MTIIRTTGRKSFARSNTTGEERTEEFGISRGVWSAPRTRVISFVIKKRTRPFEQFKLHLVPSAVHHHVMFARVYFFNRRVKLTTRVRRPYVYIYTCTGAAGTARFERSPTTEIFVCLIFFPRALWLLVVCLFWVERKQTFERYRTFSRFYDQISSLFKYIYIFFNSRNIIIHISNPTYLSVKNGFNTVVVYYVRIIIVPFVWNGVLYRQFRHVVAVIDSHRNYRCE